MSQGWLPPTITPADASASRTSSPARRPSNVESSLVAVALACMSFLLHHSIENQVEQTRHRQACPREHPRKALGDRAVRDRARSGLAVAVAARIALQFARRLEQPKRAAVLLDERVPAQAI